MTEHEQTISTVHQVRPDPSITCVVRLWLPDRPGALGQVASRVGAVRGDVVGIDILERGGGRAVDELTVRLPDESLVSLLLEEIAQVDGVAVEDLWQVEGERPDPGLAALDLAARLVACAPATLHVALVEGTQHLLGARWVAIVADDGVVAAAGAVPEPAWLEAFLAGSRHLESTGAPGDLAWATLGDGATLVVGRSGRPFHTRERLHLDRLAQIAGATRVRQPVA